MSTRRRNGRTVLVAGLGIAMAVGAVAWRKNRAGRPAHSAVAEPPLASAPAVEEPPRPAPETRPPGPPPPAPTADPTPRRPPPARALPPPATETEDAKARRMAAALETDEGRLMTKIRSVVETKPEQALVLIDAADRAHPEGTFTEERAALKVDALVSAGRIGPARDAAEQYLRRYPSGPHARHVETLTGVHPRPTGPE